jgi:hypothetical protein
MKLTFGKHKGKDLYRIAIQDPGYILWMMDNDVMEIPKAIIMLAKENKRSSIEPGFELTHGDDWGCRD